MSFLFPFKAVVCSVYGPLLEFGPAPADANAQWTRLWQEKFKRAPRVSLQEFNLSADLALQADLSLARATVPSAAHPGSDTHAGDWCALARNLELDAALRTHQAI